LTWTGGGDATLELIGDGGFGGPMTPFPSPAIMHGESETAQGITLFSLICKKRNTTSPGNQGARRTLFLVGLVVFGEHYGRYEDISFNACQLSITRLREWLSAEPFLSEDRPGTAGQIIETVVYRPPDPIIVDLLDTQGIKVRIYSQRANEWQTSRKVTLEHRVTLELGRAEPMPLDDWLKLALKMRDLFSLLIGTPVFIAGILGEGWTDQAGRPSQFAADGAVPTLCTIFFKQPHQRLGSFVHGAHMLLSYPRVKDEFPRIVGTWLGSHENLQLVYELFAATMQVEKMYVTTRFLHVCQALEGFHRAINGGNYLTAEAYDSVREALVNSIPQDTPSGLRDKLKNTLKHANEYSLAKRLRGLVDSLATETQAYIATDLGRFIQSVKDTRNFLTHLDRDADMIVLEGDDLWRATNKLVQLLTIFILRHLGVREGEVVARQRAILGRFADPFER
jgi:hypothetical protein